MTPRCLLASLVAALLIGVTAAPARAAPVLLDRVVATVDNLHIYRSDVLRRARLSLIRLARSAPGDRQAVDAMLREVVARMVEEALIQHECARLRINVGPEEVDLALDAIARLDNLDRAELLVEVAKQGFSEAEYRALTRFGLLERKWLALKARPPLVAPAGGTEDEKNRAIQALTDKARATELARLRRDLVVEVRW